MSGGQIVRQEALKFFYGIGSEFPLALDTALIHVNGRIGAGQKAEGISIPDAAKLAGASFLLLEIRDTITLIQGGDCLAFWRYSNGRIEFTDNQAYQHVSENLRTIANLMRKHHNDREKMWDEFFPILSCRRARDINNPRSKNGFAALNGQIGLGICRQTIEIFPQGLEFILLFSDGFVPCEETSPERIAGLADRLCSEYPRIGLNGILQKKRNEDEEKATSSHVTCDEATALAIRF